MNKWQQDLKQGETGEQVIANYIMEQRPQYGLGMFNKDKKYDFSLTSTTENTLTFECKTDRWEYFKDVMTYNIFIETECNGNVSGVMSSEADYFIYYYPDFEEAYLISSKDLRNFVKEHPHNGDGIRWVSKAGDGGRVKGVLIHRNFWSSIFRKLYIKKDKDLWD